MSDEEVTVETSDGQILSAEYKDGQLQIVEVTPFDKDRVNLQKPLTPTEILERAKSLQKAKALLASSRSRGRGRKRKSDLPPPHELLASPNFKLYLYSCKLCSFKCNAVKDMSAHKAREHTVGGTRGRAGSGRGAAVTLQCARCPYRASTHSQLMKHVQDKHLENHPVHLNTEEVEAADVLVCGACGFESGSRSVFRKHIEEEHGATTC
ncbi:hypothetical protein HF086_018051 [Spodoptera exigua]|uniref:C2H2-type domain-containing protein n=1 Tax=Spodoptera exigua TaxID=7107 RepID=A0A922N0C6_SPOEX|nr:hypothetical protein HF086_018051 [Spodoptera exigua]